MKNTAHCPLPVLEPGPLNPGGSALTMRPLCLQCGQSIPVMRVYIFSCSLAYWPVVDLGEGPREGPREGRVSGSPPYFG